MEKIVVIGPPGAGKTTFAKKLGLRLNIKPIHLDRIFWEHGWKEKSRDRRIDILQKLVMERRWIIEGSNLSASESRMIAADTIIFLDISPLLCLWRIIRRHNELHGHSRRDIPEGCTDKLTLLLILKVLFFPLHGRRKLAKKLPSEKVIRLYLPKEVEKFLAQPEVYTYEKRQETKALSVFEKSFDIILCFIFLIGFFHF